MVNKVKPISDRALQFQCLLPLVILEVNPYLHQNIPARGKQPTKAIHSRIIYNSDDLASDYYRPCSREIILMFSSVRPSVHHLSTWRRSKVEVKGQGVVFLLADKAMPTIFYGWRVLQCAEIMSAKKKKLTFWLLYYFFLHHQ